MLNSALLSDEHLMLNSLSSNPALWEEESEVFPVKIGISTVTVSTTRNDRQWIAYGAVELNKLAELSENWDSYGTLPVEQGSLEQAFRVYLIATQNREMNQLPHFTATPDGGVGLMWHHGDKGLEVEVLGPLFVKWYFYDDSTNHEWSGDVSLDLSILNERLDEIYE